MLISRLMAMVMALGKMQFEVLTWVNSPRKSRVVRSRNPKVVGSATMVGCDASRISLGGIDAELVRLQHRPRMSAGPGFAVVAETARYRNDNLDEVLHVLDMRSRQTGRCLERLSVSDWARIGIGSDGDELTVLVLARRLAHEGRHHLQDVGRARPGSGGRPGEVPR